MKAIIRTTLFALAAAMTAAPILAQEAVSESDAGLSESAETAASAKAQKKALMQQKRAERKAAMQQKRAERRAAMQQSDDGTPRKGRKGRRRREAMRSEADAQSDTAE